MGLVGLACGQNQTDSHCATAALASTISSEEIINDGTPDATSWLGLDRKFLEYRLHTTSRHSIGQISGRGTPRTPSASRCNLWYRCKAAAAIALIDSFRMEI